MRFMRIFIINILLFSQNFSPVFLEVFGFIFTLYRYCFFLRGKWKSGILILIIENVFCNLN